MLAFGFIWAALAPLFTLGLVIAAGYALRRRSWRRPFLLAAGVVIVPLAAVYLYDRSRFHALCAQQSAKNGVWRTAQADGFVLTSGTANSFGMRYLHQEGFRFFETLDYMQGYKGWARWERGSPGNPEARTKIDGPTARYEVREIHEQHPGGASFSITEVRDREIGGELMARASIGRSLGGRASWALGAWGTASCENLKTAGGSAEFARAYALAHHVLNPSGPRR